MKCKIPEISWHNRDPVLSVDIQPKSNLQNCYRLASGGTDAHVLIWYMKLTSSGENGDIELDLAADLTRHQRAVNVVKWSPNGELLASGDDESVVFIWKQKPDSEPLNIVDSTNEQDKEVWITLKVLRGHMEDIYDLSWAPNSLFLVSGSVDNTAMIWDVQKGKSVCILKDHKGFVQGVAWDPKNQYIATLSTDRYLRIFDIQTKKVLNRVSKGTLPVAADNNLHGKRMRLFHDDTLQTFFRRLSFTPDGKLLLTPSGVTDYDGCTRPLNTTYAFSRYGFRQPAIVLPCPDQYTVAVRCCPLLYKLRPYNEEKNPPVVPLPYRMIFAVATKSSVYFYDTQQKQPFALISNIHYTRLTDITWSNDGRIVVVSSTDGFCSLITFENGELGEEYENSEAALEVALAQVVKKTKKQKDNEGTSKARKASTDDTVPVNNENTNAQKEVQLNTIPENEDLAVSNKASKEAKNTEVVTEQKEKEAASGQVKDQDDQKPSEQKIQNDSKSPSPISVKRKPGIIAVESKTEMKATPIAIKRKPGPVTKIDNKLTSEKILEDTTPPKKSATIPSKVLDADIIKDKEILSSEINKETTVNEKQAEEKTVKSKSEIISAESKTEVKATPIAIKRKPGPVSTIDDKEGISEKVTEETTPPKKSAVIPSKVLAADIIIDKEILSSDERFESPEKKCRPVTPISVRRHPRTPSSLPQTPTSMSNILKSQSESGNQSPMPSETKDTCTPNQGKKAKPIAVRRTPRAIISTPSVVNTTSLVEEAMDAWPLEKESSKEETLDKDFNKDTIKNTSCEVIKDSMKEPGITPLQLSETTCERTEDIRLIYEETNDEVTQQESLPQPSVVEDKPEDIVEKSCVDSPKPQTPGGNKTPRRVALKTISTPKSKKKLLD